MAERLALPTSDHGVAGSNPAGGEILPEPKRRFIAQSLSCSPFHRLEVTEIVLKGRKTLTHPSILVQNASSGLDQSDLGLHCLPIHCLPEKINTLRIMTVCEPRHDKTNTMSVRPAKNQISLGIHPV